MPTVSTPLSPNRLAKASLPPAWASRQLVGAPASQAAKPGPAPAIAGQPVRASAAPAAAALPARPKTAPPSQPAKPILAADHYTPARRQDRYRLEADLVGSRIYVIDKQTGQSVDRYKTSPGTAEYPTEGTHFTIRTAQDKAPWNPPASTWAKDATSVPGGENNPMGIFKMSLGGYAEYIHGTPSGERKALGTPASHGCLRMSNENVLQLFQRYAGVGTQVDLNRDPAESQRLQSTFAARGLKEHAITDGAELLPDAIAGKAPTPLTP